MPETGSEAVDFTLPDEHDSPVALCDFRGKRVVLYLYPKDNILGCTKQACISKTAYEEFKREDIVVIEISKDSSASRMKLKEKCEFPFLPLSGVGLSVIQTYDIWREKKLYGKTYVGVTRSTYVIDEEGVIIKAFERVSPASNAADILQHVKNIRWTSLYALL